MFTKTTFTRGELWPMVSLGNSHSLQALSPAEGTEISCFEDRQWQAGALPGDNLANMLTEEIILQSASLTLMLAIEVLFFLLILMIITNCWSQFRFRSRVWTVANLRSWESSRSHWAGLFLDGVCRLGSSLLKGLRFSSLSTGGTFSNGLSRNAAADCVEFLQRISWGCDSVSFSLSGKTGQSQELRHLRLRSSEQESFRAFRGSYPAQIPSYREPMRDLRPTSSMLSSVQIHGHIWTGPLPQTWHALRKSAASHCNISREEWRSLDNAAGCGLTHGLPKAAKM